MLEVDDFFPRDSYLGVFGLFLRVLEVARSRRLGYAGEYSVWQIPENGVCTSPCQHGQLGGGVFFLRKILDGAFSYGKNDQ